MVLVQVPSGVYAAGTRSFEATVDPSLTRIRITLTRESWPGDPQTDLIFMGLEVSLDGVTYPPISGCSTVMQGGVKLGRTGQPVLTDYVECSLPGEGLTTRKVRATIDNVQQLRTAVTVEGF